jgi:LacI family transcriptional regulator
MRPGSGDVARRRAGSRVNIREVAQRAGVAMSSVSRVLSDHPDVSEQMRERVLRAVDELAYEPDWLAQSLRRQETRTIGFVMNDISNPILAQVALGAERVLRESGYSMLVTNSEGVAERDAEHIQLFGRRRVDGLMLATAIEGHRPTIAALRELSVPAVVIDRNLPRSLHLSAAYFDHRTGMRDATNHLLELGHRRITVVLGQHFRPSIERRRGVEEAYAERGLEPTFDVIEGTYSEEHGREATRAALDRDKPPTAVIAASNQLVIGAIREISSRRLRIGKDLSLVACDEISLTELSNPPIAVVDRDNLEIGRESARLLLRRLGGTTRAESVTLSTRFIPRASAGPPPRGA